MTPQDRAAVKTGRDTTNPCPVPPARKRAQSGTPTMAYIPSKSIPALVSILQELSSQFLYPDDLGDDMAESIKGDPDYEEVREGEKREEVFISRRSIRNARALLSQITKKTTP